MSIPRPKILTAVTVPSGGWDFKFYLSNAAQYDTAFTATVPAGDYFMSGDNQTDDFLYQLQLAAATTINGTFGANALCFIDIAPTNHVVRIKFAGSVVADAAGDNDVKLAWTESDSGIYETLGFDGTADDTSTATDYPRFDGDYHHAYGWYSDEDGQLESFNIADSNTSESTQGRSIGGQSKTQYRGEYFESVLRLAQIERNFNGRTKMISDGVGYGDASVHPYNRNEPLECWWREAMQGKRFRVYRDGFINILRAAEQSSNVSDRTTTTMEDDGRSWSLDPYRWIGRILYTPSIMGSATPAISQSFYISSHTAIELTVGNPLLVQGINILSDGDADNHYLFDHPYETYVLDLGSMSTWDTDSMEIPSIDRYDIEIPLMRYIA